MSIRWARAKCKFIDKGNIVTIQGRYFDNPLAERTVSVFKEDLDKLNNGTVRHVQDAFPYLSADDREFLISGMSPEGWDKTFKDES